MGFNGGKACVVLDQALATYDAPYLNQFKSGNSNWQAQGSVTGDPNTLYDSRGYPTAMPSGTGTLTWEWFGWAYGEAGDVWVLDWPNATTTMHAVFSLTQGSASEAIISSTRREYTLSGTPFTGNYAGDVKPNPTISVNVFIDAMATNDFAGGSARFYLKDGSPSGPTNETMLNNGQIFAPDFVRRVGSFGVVHYENQTQESNANFCAGIWADRSTLDTFDYYAPQVLSRYYAGSSTGTGAQVVSQPPSTISSWTQGQKVQWVMTTAPVFIQPTTVTPGNPTSFFVPSHGLSNGDLAQWSPVGGGTWRSLTQVANGNFNSQFWTVTAPDANNVTVPFDSSGLLASDYPAINSASFTASIALTVMTVTAVSSGTIAVGQVINGSGVTRCTIISLGTGTGGTGTYNISTSQTIASEAMTSANPLPFLKVMTLKVGSLGAIQCVQMDWSANLCAPGWAFGQTPFHDGDFVDAIYDSALNLLLCSNTNFTPLMPHEAIIAFSNQTGSNPYINLSTIVDDNYITQMATLYKSSLDSTLNIHVELGNEIWGYPPTGYCAARARSDLGTDNFHNYYGKRVAQISDLFKAVYGGGRYKILMGAQYGSGGSASYVNNAFILQSWIDLPYSGRAVSSITIASPAVVTTSSPHLLLIGDPVILTSTGSLPSPFVDSVNGTPTVPLLYYVISAGFSATTVQLSTTPGGAAINTTGSQSGSHTIAKPPITQCDAVVVAPYYDTAFDGYSNAIDYPNSRAAGGWCDQVDNYTNGSPGDQQAALTWFKNEYVNTTQDPTNFPNVNFPVSVMISTQMPFWINNAVNFLCECHNYEGSQGLLNGGSVTGGFPGVAPTSGRTVTVANVLDFLWAFFQSQQYADLTFYQNTQQVGIGVKFPAQFTAQGPWNYTNQNYPAIQPLDTVMYNGIIRSPTNPAYTALRLFNDPVPTGQTPPRIKMLRM